MRQYGLQRVWAKDVIERGSLNHRIRMEIKKEISDIEYWEDGFCEFCDKWYVKGETHFNHKCQSINTN